MRSIQANLAIGLTISVTLLLLAQWILINKSIHQLSEQYLSTRLQHDADAIIAATSFTSEGFELDQSRLGPIYKQPFSGHYYQLLSNDKQYRSRSLWDQTILQVMVMPGSSQISRQPGPEKQQLLVLNSAYTKQGNNVVISVAEDLTPVNRNIDDFLRSHTWVSLGVLLVLLMMQFVIVRRSLRPLETIRRELEALQSGSADHISENVPREILALVKELNSGMKNMQKKILRSRNAAGNLAHGLKRPLTLLRQLTQSDEVAMSPVLSQKLNKHIVDLQSIIDSELRRARLAGRVIGGRHFDLKEEINDLVSALTLMYQAKPLQFDCIVPDEIISPVEREDLHEMLGNLLDNACKWAESRVLLRVDSDANQITFTIEDDGAGLQTDEELELNNIVQRGKRLDESKPGHGLGLAIVKDIVDAYGGSLTLSRSDEHQGMTAVIVIPNII